MKILYETKTREDDVFFKISITEPCCALSTALTLDKIVEVQSINWQKPFETQSYLMVDGQRFKIDFCPGCGKKIEIKETKRTEMVKRTRTLEYWE